MTPDEAALTLEQGLAHHHSGRMDEAETLYRQVLDADPANADALHLLGVLEFQSGRAEDAAELITKAVKAQPKNPQFLNNLGEAFRALGKLAEAAKYYKRAIKHDPGHLGALNNLGNVLSLQNKPDEAMACFGRALEINPDAEDVISNMALLKKEAGDRAAAEGLYRRLLAINPEDAETYYNLSGVRKFSPGDADLKAMEDLGAGPDVGPEKAMYLGFALGKAYGDIGEHDRAFEHISGANRLKREMLDYDGAGDEKRVDRIIGTFDQAFMDARLGENKGQGFEAGRPIFIIGMPRSGTTLAEQILASHSDVHGAGEVEILANVIRDFTTGGKWTDAAAGLSGEDFQALGEAYMGLLSPLAPGVPRITDKMPRNFFFAGIIALALPNAKIVHCRRDPVDTCLSNFQHLFPGGQEFTYDQGELGRYYVLYARLMDHWRTVLGGRIFDLDYEALVAEPEPVMRDLLEFCDLPWQDACLDFHKTERPVRTASAQQVRRPLYTSAVKRWKRYEKQLAPLLDALGPLAARD